MIGENGSIEYEVEAGLQDDIKSVAESIYKAYLPEYLRESWKHGRGKWYEDWLKQQLDMLVISEICDDRERLNELKHIEREVSVIFGILATSFRLLDHIGMHLRAQTLGQYELWPEDEKLLTGLCRELLKRKSVRTRLPRMPFGFLSGQEPEN